ncbi:hypothetical protein BLNAU_22946 [Blattamonas nauphoetae]|uniref:Uncharacterized protein n=1 Tax=Blattamonas nauphoetae TaxID=2049346 RepID=A0ABQ9WRQ1_9EUKA|nr:hypothetical protein BLNAU_22946 [Blattamonas nauphoetae]
MENQIVLEGVTITSPSSTHKYQVFISCPSAAAHVKASWSSFVPPVPTIPLQLHSNFWCEDSADTSKSSCMAYHVYPFTSGTVHVSDRCEDHVLCGSVDAPHCSVGGSGGVLFVSCASSIISTQLVVKVTSFDMCSSDSGKGGCVFVSDITRTDRKPVLGRRCYTLVNTIQLSHAAYVSCQFLSSCRLSRIRWTRCVGCGRSDLPCGTLEHSLTHLSTHSTNIVTIASSASLDFELETTRSSLELSGKGEIKQNAKVEDGGLITASGNSFTLNNLHLSTELASAPSMILIVVRGMWIPEGLWEQLVTHKFRVDQH